jgi:hypothetical protein
MKTAQDYQKIIEKNKTAAELAGENYQPYHDRIFAEYKKDPKTKDELHLYAVKGGTAQAAAFLNKVRDFNDPDHEKALARYKNEFGMNEGKVREKHVKEMIDLMDAAKPEIRNTAYEKGVLNNYHMTSSDDVAFYRKFCDLMKKKWEAVGYAGDRDAITDFWKAHPLSTPQAGNQYHPDGAAHKLKSSKVVPNIATA